MSLSKKDIEDVIDQMRAQPFSRPTPTAIPPLRHFSSQMCKEVGATTDTEVAQLAYMGGLAAYSGVPMHPRNAIAMRIAWARSGAEGDAHIHDDTYVKWVAANLATRPKENDR